MNIRNDVTFALRQIARRPGFTLAVVLTLAIGIGANAAMFGIVNGVLLSSLPYPDADRLVVVTNSYPGLGLVLALMLGFGLRSMLFGVGAADPVVYLSAVALLGFIAFCACAIPSWRAARVNPVDALRDD